MKNYTGDRINFGLAAEILTAGGTEVRMVLIDDDLATEPTEEGDPGRRGTAATLVVEKLCGAAAERGADLDEVAELARQVVDNSRSLAISFSGAQLPGASIRSFDVPVGKLEYGVGIHGERGTSRIELAPAREIVAEMVDAISESLTLASGSEVVAVVNGLGATRMPSCISSTASSRGPWPRAGWWSPAAWWARSSRPWTCVGSRSP